ncbi:hypothetical protein LXA47_10590 [Massilia sp. P8910]|uniref:hypothetical protein n=1 Tax=Massilia antarctica TaxID=2765360 RepID=UPI001E3644B1|nr:hypothetical protein [Massilia antarctica]MCE3604049.1 hypothetical protein [Massilia antarctica]
MFIRLTKATFGLILFLLTSMGDAHADGDCEQLVSNSQYLAYFYCVGDKDDMISIHNRSMALSFIGEERRSAMLFEKVDLAEAMPLQGEISKTPSLLGYFRFDALSILSKMAMSRKIVMINEAHHVSRHRIFGLQLAKLLKKQGYTYLAVEGLSSASKTQQSGYVALKDPGRGVYTADPEFAYFLREAVAIGFKLVAYEAFDTNTMAEREQTQAANIAALINRDPDAKILVYAGYGHIRKNRTKKGFDWMAKRLRDLTGIDPLAIDQVGGTPNYYSALTDPAWVQANSMLLTNPSVFAKGANWLVSKSYDGFVDLTVFHPAERLVSGRPDWLYPGRRQHFVASGLIGKTRPALLRAVMANDKNGVPIDQVAVDQPEGATLLLPPGTYFIEVETRLTGNKRLYSTRIY